MIRKIIVEIVVFGLIATGAYYYHSRVIENVSIKAFRSGFIYSQIIMRKNICKDV